MVFLRSLILGTNVMTTNFLLRYYSLKEIRMSSQMNEENKRLSAKRKSALMLEIIQGKTTVRRGDYPAIAPR